MPIETIGLDVKYSGVDMDPKTYSPMSGSDENMSSPPSVLTTASAGSCTPSSLPSAGSTPSSIPSTGSTPYQFVSQEESTSIKPLTPSDYQSLPPSTPDQPITPEPSVQHGTVDLQGSSNSEMDQCKEKTITGTTNILSNQNNINCLLRRNTSSGISDNVREKREDCPCLVCVEKQSTSLQSLSCKDTKFNENKNQVMPIYSSVPSDLKSAEPPNIIKPKLPIVKQNNPNNKVKYHRKSAKIIKNVGVHYESELSGDPESTSIKIRIKLTSTGIPKQKTYTPIQPSIPSTTSVADSYDFSLSEKGLQATSKRKSRKRKSANKCSSKCTIAASKKSKNSLTFSGWGPPLKEVNGELQSGWAYQLPVHIIEKIFNYATYCEECIPFLHRASKVCRLWREVAISPRLLHTVDLSTGLIQPRYRTEKRLLWIIENRLKYVQYLDIAGWVDAVSPFILKKISELCPRLVSLNITSCSRLHGENICTALSNSPQLQQLDLTNVMGIHKPTPRCAVGQQTMSELASLLKGNLTHLILANNTVSNVPSIMGSLSINCGELRVLDLSSVGTIGRDNVRLDIEKLQTGCPKLVILRLANSFFRLNDNSMSIQVSSPGFADLEELSLAVDDRINSGMNDLELERILKNANKLRLLDVRGCHNITDSSLVKIPPWDIEHLYLSGGSTLRVYSDRLELVLRKWQHSLRELDLSWTGSYAAIDTAIFTLAEESNDKLQILNLCGSSVNFEPVRKLLKKCPSLCRLNLTSCRAMPRGVKRLYETQETVNQFKQNIEDGKYDEIQTTD